MRAVDGDGIARADTQVKGIPAWNFAFPAREKQFPDRHFTFPDQETGFPVRDFAFPTRESDFLRGILPFPRRKSDFLRGISLSYTGKAISCVGFRFSARET